MTQFLLVQNAEQPALALYRATPTIDEDYLMPAACLVFSDGEPVWTIRPVDGEMDDVVHESQRALLVGLTYSETPLAALLEALTNGCNGLALFMFSFSDDLPLAATPVELQGLVEMQLRDEGSMAEIYAQWKRR